ncbi:MAG TPA: PHP domain-containing protein [Bacteroidales bacterium]|nr:PHP domain-containing protein [Bacteroidales bacterium]
MINADLHIHTVYSADGELSTGEILNLARSSGMETIAITDHNVTGGISGALKDAAGAGIRVIPGIEIDCIYKGTDLHVLGYNIQWKDPAYTRLADEISGLVRTAFNEMVHNLKILGIEAEAAEIMKTEGDRLPSAEMIAEYLLGNPAYDHHPKLAPYRAGGERSDNPYLNFYLDFFAQGKPAYVKISFMDFSNAISLITGTGGIPVIAHPGHNFRGREEVVIDLLAAGAKGIEVFNNYHNESQIAYLSDVAVKRNALITCGSDFHGKNKPAIQMGQFKLNDRYEGYLTESIEELLC